MSTKKDGNIDAPQTLMGLFPPDSDDDADFDDGDDGENDDGCCYEIQSVLLGGQSLQVRQYDYHSHNANRVWPGTFNLADYLLQQNQNEEVEDESIIHVEEEVKAEKVVSIFCHQWGNILELGTATGLLAIRLCSVSKFHNNNSDNNIQDDDTNILLEKQLYCCNQIVTSDVQDEHNEVQSNLLHNYQLNNISKPPIHIPHTWGTGWNESVDRVISNLNNNESQSNTVQQLSIPAYFDTIIASDILLYVSAYGALVQTLLELFILNKNTIFVMSWNRRMKESSEFFNRMTEVGFTYKHEGKCIYTFVLKK